MRSTQWLLLAMCSVSLGSCLRREILAEAEPSLPDEPRPRDWLECHRALPFTLEQELAMPDLIVEPIAYGPRFDRLPEAIHQDAATIERALRETLHECYRWAHERDPELDGSVRGTILIDPFSRVEEAHFTANDPLRPSSLSVARCFADVLRGRELFTERDDGAWWTWVPIVVEMQHTARQSHAAADDVIAQRPRAESMPPTGVCVQHGAPVEWLDTIRVSLSDPAIAFAPSMNTKVRTRWSRVQAALTQRVAANLGAYRACWREALETDRVPPGIRDFALTFDSTGNTADVQPTRTATATPNDALDRCLSAALREVRIAPGIGAFRAALRLVLTPTTTPATLSRPTYATVNEVAWLAERTLAIGDGARAQRHLAALILEQPNECRWRALLLPALLANDPLTDTRLVAALEQLARMLRGPLDDTCFALARPALERWMGDDPQRHYRVATALPLMLPERSELFRRAADAWGHGRNYDDVCRAAAIYFDLARADCARGAPSDAVELSVKSAQRCANRSGQRHVCHGFPTRAPAGAPVQRLFDATDLLLRCAPPTSTSTTARDRLVLATLERRAASEGQLAEVIGTLVPFTAAVADPAVMESALDLLVRIHRLGTFR